MIPQYKTILYATDLSANAAHAFRHAIAVARCHDARIHILHILPMVEPAVMNYVSTVMGVERLTDLELKHKETVIEQIREKLLEFARTELIDHPEDFDRVVDIEIHHGSPVGQILEHSDSLEADLIVVGSHGQGRLKYALLGSVAEKLLRKSHRPVMVVPLS